MKRLKIVNGKAPTGVLELLAKSEVYVWARKKDGVRLLIPVANEREASEIRRTLVCGDFRQVFTETDHPVMHRDLNTEVIDLAALPFSERLMWNVYSVLRKIIPLHGEAMAICAHQWKKNGSGTLRSRVVVLGNITGRTENITALVKAVTLFPYVRAKVGVCAHDGIVIEDYWPLRLQSELGIALYDDFRAVTIRTPEGDVKT